MTVLMVVAMLIVIWAIFTAGCGLMMFYSKSKFWIVVGTAGAIFGITPWLMFTRFLDKFR